MARRSEQVFEHITTEGGLFPTDFLQRLSQSDAEIEGLKPNDYHLVGGERLNEAISSSWNRLLGAWAAFEDGREKLPKSDRGTTLTREKWLLPLFQELGYGRLQTTRAFEIDDRRYPVSHIWQANPIHLISFRGDLDTRSEDIVGARKLTPHAMVQEFLNRSEAHLWAFVSNGERLRVLRDNVSLTRQAYLEFDLRAIMQAEAYSDFRILWIMAHQSRVEAPQPELCWLEKWAHTARQQGTRVLDQLRDGVEKAIESLGSGYLRHPANAVLKEKLRDGSLSTQDFFRQVLRVVYRTLFVFTAEDRDLLFGPDVTSKTKKRYLEHYSFRRIRRIARRVGGTQHPDLWQAMHVVFRSLCEEEGSPALGLPGLGSFLWDEERALPDLTQCQLHNRDLLNAIRHLAFTVQGKIYRPIDYKHIGSEELGSIYESLLELHPQIHIETSKFELGSASGHERKTTGSYYTPSSLVQCLLESALDPVLDRACQADDPEAAILNLKVCDPAVGSGHFLIAAAHRMAKRLAAIRTGEDEPAPSALHQARRDVIGHCLYGVDLNPMAVELCKFALWLEAIEPGKPLSFLDHHIQCGNSLLGTTPALMKQGIPGDAFKPLDGDDRTYCNQFKKTNKEEAKNILGQQQGTLFDREQRPWENLGSLATNIVKLDALPEDTVADIRTKESQYAEAVRSSNYLSGKFLADMWCAAFVWKKCSPGQGGYDYPITNDIYHRVERNPHDCPPWMSEEIQRLSGQYHFFHWHLAFPDVFQIPPEGQEPENKGTGWNGGFDVVLGNPPWERVKLQEKEFFAARAPDIANASNAAARRRMITALEEENPTLFAAFKEAVREAEGVSHLLRDSNRYPLCGRGDVNLYTVFAEANRSHLNPVGLAGCVLPTGIATDDTTKLFFQDLMDTKSLRSLYDFENKNIFPNVHSSYKFCCFTAGSGVAPVADQAEFAFFLHETTELGNPEKRFKLSPEDIELLNPNTRTCPIFRSSKDAELTKSIYRAGAHSTWPYKLGTLFHSSNDAGKFEEDTDLRNNGWNENPRGFLSNGNEQAFPLYEGKMFMLYDHRAATVVFSQEALVRQRQSEETTEEQHQNPNFLVRPFFWVREEHFSEEDFWRWIIAFKKVTSPTNERTLIASLLPACAANDSIHLLFPEDEATAESFGCLLANVSSLAMDYIGRQKLGGVNFNFFIFEQLPKLPGDSYTNQCHWGASEQSFRDWILPRVLELTYTAWDLEPFAQDCGYDGPPFYWNEERRFLLRCELDAAFFHLYLGTPEEWQQGTPGLLEAFPFLRDAVGYIMETFPIVKRKDIKRTEEKDANGEVITQGTYITKDTILEIYDEMSQATQSNQPYQTRLNPPPADPTCAHPPRS